MIDTGFVPWWLKIAVKVAVTHTPLPYGFWRRVGLGRHGAMLTFDYAQAVFDGHFRRARGYLPDQGYAVLELGPGDSLASAFFAAAHGAAATWLVDIGQYAAFDVRFYRQVCHRLRLRLDDAADIGQCLERVNARYLTDGLHSLEQLPENSIDFIFSQAVLEHIRRDECDATIRAMYRAQRRGGVASHRIDLKDHLGAGLHSLRFRRRVWESAAFRRSSFYTNRLRASQLIELFRRAGYEILDYVPESWPRLPISRHKLSGEFKSVSEAELLISGLDLLLRKP